MSSVLVSHRDDDGKIFAERLKYSLMQPFGGKVLVGLDALVAPGDNVAEEISDAVQGSRGLVIVIGSDWLADDTSWLDDPADLTAAAVKAALAAPEGVKIAPVVSAELGSVPSEKLPAPLRELLAAHPPLLINDATFPRVAEQLIERLGGPPAPAAPPAAPAPAASQSRAVYQPPQPQPPAPYQGGAQVQYQQQPGAWQQGYGPQQGWGQQPQPGYGQQQGWYQQQNAMVPQGQYYAQQPMPPQQWGAHQGGYGVRPYQQQRKRSNLRGCMVALVILLLLGGGAGFLFGVVLDDDGGLSSASSGPADSDNDGISNVNDDCPYEAGTSSTDGCPDEDNDGIADDDDDCPYEYGYARYDGCAPELLETLPVYGDHTSRVYSDSYLTRGKTYLVEVSGIFFYDINDGQDIPADAEYRISDGYNRESHTMFHINGDPWRHANSGYSETNTYEYYFSDVSGRMSFHISDSWYLDNSGSLTVRIYEMPD